MNSRRSYLESLNAGRRRRPPATLEDLNRTLQTLEANLDASRQVPRQDAEPQDDSFTRRMQRIAGRDDQSKADTSRPAPDIPGAPQSPEEDRSLDALARDIERARLQEEEMTAVARIAGELKGLRGEIERAYAVASTGAQGAELGLELERLSAAIHSLAERSDAESSKALRLEVEQVKEALEQLAREETVLSVGRRWDEFDRSWKASEEQRIDPRPAFEALNERLDQIGSAVSELPESLPLRSLEEKVRTLAGVIDQFSRQQEHVSPQSFEMIGERLDEISRAIAASSVGTPVAAIDPQPFERIEARITSLARQIEELAQDRPVQQLVDGLAVLTGRVDEISRRAEMPDQAVTALAQQIEAITEKLDAGHGADALFRGLERRLDELAQKLDAGGPAGAANLDAIEARLEDISARLELSAKQTTGIDPELIRNLEAQVSSLSEHLARPSAPLPDFEDIGPRLDHIEQSIAQSRDSLLDAARQVAEQAVRNVAGAATGEDAAALAGDLKSLEMLTRRSDERNVRAFEAIHDTLLKIVERLAALEEGGERRVRAWADTGHEALEQQGKLSLDDAPPMEPEALEPRFDLDEELDRSPSQAAAAAARAALNGETEQPAKTRRRGRSMLGGITRAFSGRGQGQEPVALAGDRMTEGNLALAPEIDLDEPLDPKIANRPLEPGSGAPDLSAIMKRVRDERAPAAGDGEADAAKSDFIAAARRAAQAAAAEAEVLKKQADKKVSEKGKLGLGGLLRSRRKMLLGAAAAITVALAGLQFGRAFLADVEDFGMAESAAVEELAADSALVEPAVSAPAVEAIADAAPEAPEVRSVEAAAAAPAEPEPVAAKAIPETAVEPSAAPGLEVPAIPAGPQSEPVMPQAAPAIGQIPEEAGPLALRQAAAGGDAKALFAIGARYAEGRGVAENLAEAAQWYEKAAEQGLAPAQYRIGNFYEKGLGVSRDIAKAKTWYQLAAEQGNASAMHNLAVLFAMGADGAPDNDAAARWFLEAAELGVTDSQFNLGILAAKGVGMTQNLEESYKWFALVAKTGDRDAAAKRDEIAKALAPEKLERARAATELWRAKPLDPEANGAEVPESWKDGEKTTASADMKEVVKNIQSILNESGYDAGTADGIMGGKTKSAIAAFQKANGLASTGDVSTELVQALLDIQ